MNEHPKAIPLAFYKVKEMKSCPGRFVAWASLNMLSGAHVMDETARPVHFHIAESEQAAVAAVTKEMDMAYGPRRWWRQA